MINFTDIYSALGGLKEQSAAMVAELNAVTAERDALAEELRRIRNAVGTDDLSGIVAGPRPFVGPPV